MKVNKKTSLHWIELKTKKSSNLARMLFELPCSKAKSQVQLKFLDRKKIRGKVDIFNPEHLCHTLSTLQWSVTKNRYWLYYKTLSVGKDFKACFSYSGHKLYELYFGSLCIFFKYIYKVCLVSINILLEIKLRKNMWISV